MSELLTISRLKSYRACPRRHSYEYDQGLRPVVDAPALRFGTAMHAALEAYWATRQLDASGAYSAALFTLGASGLAEDGPAMVRALVLLAAYTTVWDRRAVEVLAVEREFRLPLVNPATGCPSLTWDLAGKIDLLLRLEDGRIAIVEHKTTSSDPGAGGEYRDRLVMDGQVSLYFTGAEALGFKADICVYDVLVKPALKPYEATPADKLKLTKAGVPYASQRLHAETLEEYRARVMEAVCGDPGKYLVQVEVPRLEDERRESDLDVWQTAKRMREDRASRIAPRNPDACHRYGSVCPYLPVCQRRASVDDPALYTLRGPHPELTQSLTRPEAEAVKAFAISPEGDYHPAETAAGASL